MATEKHFRLTVPQRIIRAGFITTASVAPLLVFGSTTLARMFFKLNSGSHHRLGWGIVAAMQGPMQLALLLGILLMLSNKPLQMCPSMWIGLAMLAIALVSCPLPY